MVYLTPKLDLDGSQLEGKELVCICSSYRPRYGFTNCIPMLVVRENTEELAERVGFCKFRKTYVQIDRKWVDPQEKNCLKMPQEKLELRTIRLG